MPDNAKIAKDVTNIVNKNLSTNPGPFLVLVSMVGISLFAFYSMYQSNNKMDIQNAKIDKLNDIMLQMAQNSSLSNQKLSEISLTMDRMEKHQEDLYYKLKH